MSGGTLTQYTGRLSKQQLQPLATGLANVQVKKFGSDTGQLEVPNGVKSITVQVIERPAPSMA
jgi:hypothetical protein